MRYLLYILVLIFSVQGSFAQSFHDAAIVGAKIDSMYMITVSTPSEITFTGANDFMNGKTIPNFSTISVKCNFNWQLSVRSSTANFTATGGGASTNIPCSILRLKKSTSASYITLSTTGQLLANGVKGPSSASGNSFVIEAFADPGFTYNGGTYSIVLTYTLTKQ